MKPPRCLQHWMENPVLRNILLLFSGTGVAQLIPIVIQLLLARIYTVAQFGELAVVTSITGIGWMVATLNYEYAIVIVRRHSQARTMLYLSLFAAVGVSAVCALILLIGKPYIGSYLHVSDYRILWITPPLILMMGWVNALTSWYNRAGAYRKMVTGQLTQGLSIPAMKLLFGLVGITSGLVWGTLVGYLFALVYFVYLYLSDEGRRGLFRSLSLSKLKQDGWAYRDFAIYATLGSLFNGFSQVGFPLLITLYYPIEVAGLYFFANSIVRMPINLLASAIGKVYKKEASEMYHSRPHELYGFTLRIQKLIIGIVLPLLLLLSAVGEPLFSLLFGDTWAEAGNLVRYFALFVFFNAIYSPISSIADILRHQKLLLLFNVSVVVCQVVVFVVGAQYPFHYVLLATSVVGALHYLLLDGYMKFQLKRYAR